GWTFSSADSSPQASRRRREMIGMKHEYLLLRCRGIGSSCSASARLKSEKLAQSLGLGATDRNLRLLLVIHSKLVRAFKPGNDFLDAVDVDQERTVRAPEKVRVKGIEQFFQGAAIGLAFSAVGSGGDHADHAVFDRGVADVSLIHQQ